MRNSINSCIVGYCNVSSKLLNSRNQKEVVRNASRCLSSYEGRARRSFLFSREQKRQREDVGRIEKIQVQYKGTPEDVTLAMNKNISTPYNCAQHMSEMLMRRTVLALVDGTHLWDVHRPLERDCTLELLHFKAADPFSVNKAFWRTCSLILGAVAERCFKPEVTVKLHSFPSPNVKSGSFVYDVDLSLPAWRPTADELRIVSSEMVKLCQASLPLERLSVSADLALDMFRDNEHKAGQVPHIATQLSEGAAAAVTLYRLGDHVDISRGPVMADTGFVGRCTVAAVHRLESDRGNLYRLQGVALPKGFLLNHFAYGVLEERARKLNPGRLPSSSPSTDDQPITEAIAQ